MQLKPINTESNAYRLVRGGLDLLAFVGGDFAVNNVVVPFTQLVWRNSRIMRLVSYAGAWAFGVAGGSFAASMMDDFVESCTVLWNHCAGVEFEDEPVACTEEDMKLGYTPAYRQTDSKEALDDFVAENDVLVCDSEEDAKVLCETIIGMINQFGFSTLSVVALANPRACQKLLEKHVGINPDARIYGWTKETFHPEIECIREGEWIIDAMNYDIIPDAVVTMKESDVSAMAHHVAKE